MAKPGLIPILGVVILIIYSAIIQSPLKQSIEEGLVCLKSMLTSSKVYLD